MEYNFGVLQITMAVGLSYDAYDRCVRNTLITYAPHDVGNERI